MDVDKKKPWNTWKGWDGIWFKKCIFHVGGLID